MPEDRVLILGLSMLLEEQILNSAGVSENGSSDSLPLCPQSIIKERSIGQLLA